jgi:gamma-tubulin complex component 2
VAGSPFVPPWALQRPYLTGRFLLQAQRGAPSARVVEQLFGAAAATASKAGAGDQSHAPPPLSSLPVSVQEQLVLEDLLSAFMGLEGNYVKAKVLDTWSTAAAEAGAPVAAVSASEDDESRLSRVAFVLDGLSLDKSLAALAERMLPCGGAYVGVQAFVSGAGQPERGLVAHALAAGLKVSPFWWAG